MEHLEKLERVVKSIANRRRLVILWHLKRRPGSPLFDIAARLKLNLKTASEHVHRLTRAGLVVKRAEGSTVRHVLTPLGKNILEFLRRLDNDF